MFYKYNGSEPPGTMISGIRSEGNGEKLVIYTDPGKKLLCYYRQNDINLYQCVLYEMTVQYFKNAPEKT